MVWREIPERFVVSKDIKGDCAWGKVEGLFTGLTLLLYYGKKITYLELLPQINLLTTNINSKFVSVY